MGGYNEYLRRKAFLDFYSRLSDKDKCLLAQMSNPVKNDVMGKLDEIERKVEKNKYSFLTDVGANVLGNALFDIPIWLLSKLFRLK